MSDIKNNFYLDKVFPEPSEIFNFEYKTSDEILKDCIFIFDTNVLLVPFETSEKNLEEIKTILLKLKNEKRIFLPARVVREFANNRAKRLGDLFLKIRQTKENLNSGSFKIEKYPLLQNNISYQKIMDNYSQISELIKSSRELFNQLESNIIDWNWNDSVSQMYKEIFTPDLIIEIKKSQKELIEDLEFRIAHKIAPGYKDSGKIDDGIGDLIIWQTSLEIARETNKDLIFVTNDQKSDWFYKQDKIGLYPKFELFDEFRRFTNGKSMQIVNFPKFLEILNARNETVKEIIESIKSTEEQNQFKYYDPINIKVGSIIETEKYGIGRVTKIYKDANENEIAVINFKRKGARTFMLKYTPMKIIDENESM